MRNQPSPIAPVPVAQKQLRGRALLLTPVVPDVAGGGPAQRAYQWMHYLAERYDDVDVLVVHRRGRRCAPVTAMLPLASIREVAPTPTRAAYWRSAFRSVAATAAGLRPFASIGWGREWAFVTKPVRRQLAEWYAGVQWDRIVAFRLQVYDYASHFVGAGSTAPANVLLDFDDVESATRRSLAAGLARTGRWLEAALSWCDARHTATVERRAVKTFPHVAVCCAEDRRWMERTLTGVRTEVVPNRLYELPKIEPLPDLRTLVFLGTLGYFPNQEAIGFLVQQVLPALRREDPRWRLVVAGYDAPPGLKERLRREPGAELRGEVRHAADLYRMGGIAVAPLFSGGGTKLKVLEALAHARPLVATDHAVRGLSLRPGVHFWPAQSAADWVDACLRLAGDRGLAEQIASAGRQAVGENYIYGPRAR